MGHTGEPVHAITDLGGLARFREPRLRRPLELLQSPALYAHTPEYPSFPSYQVEWGIELDKLASVQHQQPIVVDDRPQSMRNGQ